MSLATLGRRALAVPVAVVAAACNQGTGSTARIEAVVDTVEGVPRLRYPETGAAELGWRFDTVAVIGGIGSSGEEYQFDQVDAEGLAGDAGGRVFVLDYMGKRVLGYDSQGRFIGSWGREGSGPGELQSPTGLGLDAADSLWVLDHGNRRVTLLPIDPEGEPGSIPFPEGSSFMAGRLVPRDEGAYGVLSMFSFRPGEEAGPPPRPLMHLKRDGSPGDTVWTSPPPQFDRIEADMGGGRMVMMLTQRALSPGLLWTAFASGPFVVADRPEYELRLIDPRGGPELHIERDPPPRMTTEADRELERDRRRERAAGSTFPGAEAMLEKQLAAMTFAEVVPRITDVAVDGADRLWVGVSEATPGEPERIDVYDRQGRLLGEIREPPFFPDLFYGDGLVAVLDRDEMDVQRITVTRLVEG